MKFTIIGQGEFHRRGVEFLSNQGRVSVPDGDILISLSHPAILKKEELDKYKHCINFHPGLPKYRGRHPLQWMLIDGVKKIPVCVHYMDEGVDTGDIILEEEIRVPRNAPYSLIFDLLCDMVGPMTLKAIEMIERGEVRRFKQGAGRVVKRRTPEDSEFRWDEKSSYLHRFINAMSDPMPNAFCGGFRYKRSYSGNEPGEVVALTTCGKQVVATLDGVILVEPA